MDQFADNVQALCEACQPYVWVLVVAAFLVIGIMLIIPSEKSHEAAKKAIPFVVIGLLIALGAVYLGDWVAGKISFTDVATKKK